MPGQTLLIVQMIEQRLGGRGHIDTNFVVLAVFHGYLPLGARHPCSEWDGCC